MTVLEPKKITHDIAEGSAARVQIPHHAREILIHHSVAAGQHAVGMRGLRDTGAHVRAVRQYITVHDHNAVETAAQSAGCEETAYAGPQHNGCWMAIAHAWVLGRLLE